MSEQLPAEDAILVQIQASSTPVGTFYDFWLAPKTTSPTTDKVNGIWYLYLVRGAGVEVSRGTIYPKTFIVVYLGNGKVSITPKKQRLTEADITFCMIQ
jgi:hypothetical protein